MLENEVESSSRRLIQFVASKNIMNKNIANISTITGTDSALLFIRRSAVPP
jgi:hypothetical protein